MRQVSEKCGELEQILALGTTKVPITTEYLIICLSGHRMVTEWFWILSLVSSIFIELQRLCLILCLQSS